ncbi:MAG: hypothetical protein CMN02_12100 [Roseibacillus sp.]|nr:hypothetical protein [Roseibacillus sp.]
MRNRCFIIAVVALAAGIFFYWRAQTPEWLGDMNVSVNEGARAADRNLNKLFGGVDRQSSDYVDPNPDPYAPDSTLLSVSYISFGLAGVLFLVGFIIGPPKKAS